MKHEKPSFYSCRIDPLELQMSSDKRMEDERPPNKKPEGEPAHENGQLETHEQLGDNTASVNRSKRFVNTVFPNYFTEWG